jgi:hypothetical protein
MDKSGCGLFEGGIFRMCLDEKLQKKKKEQSVRNVGKRNKNRTQDRHIVTGDILYLSADQP